VAEGPEETEFYYTIVSKDMRERSSKTERTRRGIRVVAGKLHSSREVTAVVQGFGIKNDQADFPIEYVFILKLAGLAFSMGTEYQG